MKKENKICIQKHVTADQLFSRSDRTILPDRKFYMENTNVNKYDDLIGQLFSLSNQTILPDCKFLHEK